MSGNELSTGHHGHRHQDLDRQDPLAVADLDAVPVPFELVVISPLSASGDVDVSVSGMWTGSSPVLSVFDDDARIVLDLRGVDDGRSSRPFRVTVGLMVSDHEQIVVRGARSDERVIVGELGPLALVCGLDPTLAGIEEPFLHRRGGSWVRVGSSGSAPDQAHAVRR